MSMRFTSKMALRRILHGFQCHMSMKLSEMNVQFPLIYDLPDSPIYIFAIFICGGNLRGKVYSNNPHTIEELKTNIRNAIVEITQNELEKVCWKHVEMC